jgi:hypothetical protein
MATMLLFYILLKICQKYEYLGSWKLNLLSSFMEITHKLLHLDEWSLVQ